MEPDVFKALADESRRNLLDRLRAKNGQRLSQLCDGLDMSRQAVTKHLKILEGANLISVRWHGREKLHYLNPVPLAEIVHRWIGTFEDSRLEMLLDLRNETELKEESKNVIR